MVLVGVLLFRHCHKGKERASLVSSLSTDDIRIGRGEGERASLISSLSTDNVGLGRGEGERASLVSSLLTDDAESLLFLGEGQG